MWPFKKRKAEKSQKERCEHVWTKWKPFGSGTFFQRRTCIECGFTQEKDI